MSFLLGSVTGGVVAGAVYYSFSQSFESKTRRLQNELRDLTVELAAPTIPTPVPAARKIAYSPFRETLKEQWNQELSNIVHFTGRYEVPWGAMWARAVDQVKSFSS
ncbi:hypothetical protein FRB94_011167 [Tulasnella sp. JGI-2019a]|nr:hypothetical protein FRB94_011167 [Tulasnella sp. JGI-2019a]KAG8999392.1 hypothetical protein FRB93_013271 [Tulasnella sp. JGI-2019a]